MWDEKDLPPGLLEALAALHDEEEDGRDAVVFIIRPDPREQLEAAFNDGLKLGHQFRDIFGGKLGTADDIIMALKADGRVHVTQTIELDPQIAPYL